MIVLLGGRGFVGSAIATALRNAGLNFTVLGRDDVDTYSPDALAKALRDLRATFLINSAGYTGKPNVDACELHKADCLAGNAVLPGSIRTACERVGIPFGHVSSGCLYTGRRADGGGFKETDPPNFSFRTNNCSYYSGSKALGEEVLADCPSCYIWRLRIPFNHIDSGRNYLSKMLRYKRLLLAENSLSHLDEFAAACVQSWTKQIPFGIYNVVNSGAVTTRQVTELLRQHLVPHQQFEFFENETEFMKLAAKTPRSNCVLDNSKLLQTGIEMSTVVAAIEHSLKHWQPESAPA